jgi:cytoskeletal protein RodZ
MQFTNNMGRPDRIARFVLGALLIVLTLTGTIGAWGWIGIVPIATAALNFCPLYTLLGVNTCGR